MNGVQTRFKCKLDVKRCKRFVFPPSSLLPRSNALKTKAIRYFQTDRTLTRIVSPPLEQVLINLLKNAREASARRETPKIEVKAVFAPKVTSSLTAWRCTITVRDNGEGILPEVQDKIFVPFFTTKTAGSGIGLSLCKQIMNQHGGNITVYSEPGKGSCFTLQFC